MIEPTAITNYSRTDSELQSFWLFCTMVAGKNADTTADKLGKFLSRKPADQTPFEYLHENLNDLHNMLVAHRVGQYYRLEKCIAQSLDLDLRACTVADLEGVFGVGPKTARFFILHSRRDAQCAVLDVHILRWLRQHIDAPRVPEQTPQNRETYARLERAFISFASIYYRGVPLAEVDLLLWASMSGRLENDAFAPELPRENS